jgi:uncharacterized membrane protein
MAKMPTAKPQPASTGVSSALFLAAPAFGLSWAIRGGKRSLRLLLGSAAIAAGSELVAIRGTRQLRHHTQPQVAELPVTIPLSWYAFVAQAYGLAQAAVGDHGPFAVAAATALLATATDLANDPFGLASGYWEWRDGGAYMPDVRGPNGAAGIPIGNYIGWLVIAGSSAWFAERGRPATETGQARRRRLPLLLSYLLLSAPGLVWAFTRRRWWLFGGSALAVGGAAGAAYVAAGNS